MKEEACTGRMNKDPHEWTLARQPGMEGPDDVEKCVWCNAERSVPYESAVVTDRYEIFRRRNLLIGGYDYYSNSLGLVTLIVDASTSPQELLSVVADMIANR